MNNFFMLQNLTNNFCYIGSSVANVKNLKSLYSCDNMAQSHIVRV